MRLIGYVTLLVVIAIVYISSYAAEFRILRPIPTPLRKLTKAGISTGKMPPVSKKVVEAGVKALFTNWNTSKIFNFLSKDFYDSSRLMDEMQIFPAKDAKVRLLSIKDFQVIDEQFKAVDETHFYRISTVSVKAETQIEYTDPAKGFVRLEGENEYIIRVKEYIKHMP